MTGEIHPAIEFSYEKDVRFDGHFFRAIVTTGIFCRPICPSRPARAENVLFFSTAAAAAEAGFRPCLRCRPESAPDRPDGVGVSRLVHQALRLISEGVQGKELAERLHFSPRQLRRHFVKELGAPPVAVTQTRRLLFAKKLIDETQLPMTEVAFSAGYSSVRRFNDAIQQTYGRSPSQIRNSRRNAKVARTPKVLKLKLFYRPPYAWSFMWRYLAARAVPAVETITHNRYRRTVRFGDDVGIVEAVSVPEENHLTIEVSGELSRHLLLITEKFKRLFDLRTDPEFVERPFQSNPLFVPIIAAHPGLRIPGAWDGFEVALRTILGQQVSVKAATTLMSRLVSKFGEPFHCDGEETLTRHSPRPEQLINADIASIGLPEKRAETVRAVASALLTDSLRWDTAKSLDEAIEMLTVMPSIGVWTANILAMRIMGESDAFPATDLVLRKAVVPRNAPAMKAAELEQMAEPWRPWRAYAAQMLWAFQAERDLK
ncbi:Methylphosphotriester-DNA--protein-cysteine S-methyltransferase (EC 2.1.1.n11) / DNA-3-methyladenine glycosylase II [hydrothermal vent metagenome]|uniref:Methylphosphotriester-DNA--protein-cysteine S-methyltransferase / DNA-3-methyladenine glycosylase II n=1 Tax=hydrothermal vent metagenome TaxID=652676 RepID=A0A3B0VGH0_9ZZZZ